MSCGLGLSVMTTGRSSYDGQISQAFLLMVQVQVFPVKHNLRDCLEDGVQNG